MSAETIDCPSCGGAGHCDYICGSCNGSGEGRWEGMSCRECRAKGEVTEYCDRCDGTGQIEAEPEEDEEDVDAAA